MILSDADKTIHVATTTSDALTPEKCIEFCDKKGFAYAGVKKFDECCEYFAYLGT